MCCLFQTRSIFDLKNKENVFLSKLHDIGSWINRIDPTYEMFKSLMIIIENPSFDNKTFYALSF